MAVYNGAAFLPTAVESVLAQEMGDLELIISDNASTDGTGDLAREYARRDSRVKYFRNEQNVGATANFNLSYRRSNPVSKYFALLASDDWWDPSFLRRTCEIAERNPMVAVIHSDMYRTQADGRVINRYADLFPNHPRPGIHRAARELFDGTYINIMAALVNREAHRSIYAAGDLLDPDLTLTPDFHLWLQLFVRGAVGYYLPEPLAYYRKHESAMTMPTNQIPRLREEIIIFRDKLAGVCPPDLEPTRLVALVNRLASLGFELLRAGRADEAIEPLQAAVALRMRRRLDVSVGRVISTLPVSGAHRARIWQLAQATSRALGRA